MIRTSAQRRLSSERHYGQSSAQGWLMSLAVGFSDWADDIGSSHPSWAAVHWHDQCAALTTCSTLTAYELPVGSAYT